MNTITPKNYKENPPHTSQKQNHSLTIPQYPIQYNKAHNTASAYRPRHKKPTKYTHYQSLNPIINTIIKLTVQHTKPIHYLPKNTQKIINALPKIFTKSKYKLLTLNKPHLNIKHNHKPYFKHLLNPHLKYQPQPKDIMTSAISPIQYSNQYQHPQHQKPNKYYYQPQSQNQNQNPQPPLYHKQISKTSKVLNILRKIHKYANTPKNIQTHNIQTKTTKTKYKVNNKYSNKTLQKNPKRHNTGSAYRPRHKKKSSRMLHYKDPNNTRYTSTIPAYNHIIKDKLDSNKVLIKSTSKHENIIVTQSPINIDQKQKTNYQTIKTQNTNKIYNNNISKIYLNTKTNQTQLKYYK